MPGYQSRAIAQLELVKQHRAHGADERLQRQHDERTKARHIDGEVVQLRVDDGRAADDGAGARVCDQRQQGQVSQPERCDGQVERNKTAAAASAAPAATTKATCATWLWRRRRGLRMFGCVCVCNNNKVPVEIEVCARVSIAN